MLCRVPAPIFVAALGVLISGCASKPGNPVVGVPAGRFSDAFQAAKETLRDYRFELDRVDAAGGVLTTQATGSSGFATPWIPHTSTADDTIRGFIERERRWARVIFAAPGTDPESGKVEAITARGGTDFLPAAPINKEGELTARFEVRVERVYRPGRRVDSTGVRLVSFTSDPELEEQGLEPAFAVDTRADERLAARMAADLARRTGLAAAQ